MSSINIGLKNLYVNPNLILVYHHSQCFSNLHLLCIIVDVDFWKGGKLL
nr:MAG TPA: hypothetical protein [Caudoviricetes sp.]